MIMGMLGGMMMARVAALDTTPALKALGYPFFSMAGMTTWPMAAAPATADPEISPKNMDATIVTMARPPRMNPTRALARLMSRVEIPVVVISPPARMNSGMASRGNLDAPPKIISGIAASGAVPWISTTTMVAMASTNPMGTFRADNNKTRPRTTHPIYCPSSIALGRAPPGPSPPVNSMMSWTMPTRTMSAPEIGITL